MYYYESHFKSNKSLHLWLREIGKDIGLQVGGKTSRELMDEIQCVLHAKSKNALASSNMGDSCCVNVITTD